MSVSAQVGMIVTVVVIDRGSTVSSHVGSSVSVTSSSNGRSSIRIPGSVAGQMNVGCARGKTLTPPPSSSIGSFEICDRRTCVSPGSRTLRENATAFGQSPSDRAWM